jgi:uncharacterized protein with WD repeat
LLSPNGKYLLCYNYKVEVYLVSTETFKKIKFKLANTEIHSITWSEDSKKIAIIQTHEEMCKTDKLLLYRINE